MLTRTLFVIVIHINIYLIVSSNDNLEAKTLDEIFPLLVERGLKPSYRKYLTKENMESYGMDPNNLTPDLIPKLERKLWWLGVDTSNPELLFTKKPIPTTTPTPVEKLSQLVETEIKSIVPIVNQAKINESKSIMVKASSIIAKKGKEFLKDVDDSDDNDEEEDDDNNAVDNDEDDDNDELSIKQNITKKNQFMKTINKAIAFGCLAKRSGNKGTKLLTKVLNMKEEC